MKPRLIISTCGISLASNVFRQYKDSYPPSFSPYIYANETSPSHTNALGALTKLSSDVKRTLIQASIIEQRKLSAELNALWGFYDNQPHQHSDDVHFLIHTDTWLGQQVAEALKEGMEQYSLNASIVKIEELNTSSLESFRNGTGELIHFLEETLKGYTGRYQIIFNLSGGFKSIQGVMQNLASIYADEVIYIFENSDALLRIPRLPMTWDWEKITSYLVNLRRLAMKLPIDNNSPNLPNIFLYRIEDEAELSAWGQLIAKRSQKKLYPQKLWPSPSKKIRYSKKFERNVSAIDAERTSIINQRIDELARCMERGINNRNLDLKSIKGKKRIQDPPYGGSTHEIDAWGDKDAKRIYCHYDPEDDSTIILDTLDKALH